MSVNSIVGLWVRRDDQQHLTDEQLRQIKETFSVLGELKPVKTAPGYAVSDGGRVFSGVLCSWAECPRELKPIRTGAGYFMVSLHVNQKRTAESIHRLVAFAFLPAPLAGQDRVRHLDGNPQNNAVANLAWGTQKENMADCIRHGRTNKGTKSPNAKLNDRRVRIARDMIEEGFSTGIVGAFFGVDSDTIRRACNGEQWSHVDG